MVPQIPILFLVTYIIAFYFIKIIKDKHKNIYFIYEIIHLFQSKSLIGCIL